MINKILQGDCLEVLKTLDTESIDCVVTSPPYWNLRDYGVEGQLGLEATVTEYIDKLINLFSEVKRVLKTSGTCWVNLGDSYSTKSGSSFNYDKITSKQDEKGISNIYNQNRENLPQKTLLQVPARFAIAMTDRLGYILRNEIIWYKPNVMPHSVKDRFTVDYEKIFFFVKNKQYYFKTQYEPMSSDRASGVFNKKDTHKYVGLTMSNISGKLNPQGRNKRTVWEISTKAFSEAHFATFPEELIETPIKAGCPECGIVLDPFFGAGTTGVVAKKLNRNYIGIELNPDYIEIAERRLAKTFYQGKLAI